MLVAHHLLFIIYQMVPATHEDLPSQGSPSCMKRCRKTGLQHRLPATQATSCYMENLLKGVSTSQPAWEGVLCGKIFMPRIVHVTGRIRQILVLSTYIMPGHLTRFYAEMLENTVLGYLGPFFSKAPKSFRTRNAGARSQTL